MVCTEYLSSVDYSPPRISQIRANNFDSLQDFRYFSCFSNVKHSLKKIKNSQNHYGRTRSHILKLSIPFFSNQKSKLFNGSSNRFVTIFHFFWHSIHSIFHWFMRKNIQMRLPRWELQFFNVSNVCRIFVFWENWINKKFVQSWPPFFKI